MITGSIDLSHLLTKLRKVPREVGRIMQIAVDVDAKGFVTDIISITPPFYLEENPPQNNGGEKVKPPSKAKLGKEAKKRGENAVMRDIYRAYATPGKLYQMIKNSGQAAQFWMAVKNRKWELANQILRKCNLPQIVEFDNGAEHQRRRWHGIVTSKRPTMGVRDVRQIKRYITARQQKVGLLASGFKSAADHFNVALPAWIARHASSFGVIRINRSPEAYSIIISNNARHGRANDLGRRIRWVMATEKRKARLTHRINAEIRVALRKSVALSA